MDSWFFLLLLKLFSCGLFISWKVILIKQSEANNPPFCTIVGKTENAINTMLPGFVFIILTFIDDYWVFASTHGGAGLKKGCHTSQLMQKWGIFAFAVVPLKRVALKESMTKNIDSFV